jgi:hypothetical protein
MDPDPEGPKTCGSGSPTLVFRAFFYYIYSVTRSTGALNRGHGKQKISFSRKFPFMKSRERLNKLDDEESFENGSNHR